MNTGECLCGSIKYKIGHPIRDGRCCHCSKCRKAFSGAGSAVTFLEDGEFAWVQGESGVTSYLINDQGAGLGFCKKCGSTLVMYFGGKVVGVTLGTLNNNPEAKIGEHIYVGSVAERPR